MSDTKSIQAPLGAAATPIPTENCSWEEENVPKPHMCHFSSPLVAEKKAKIAMVAVAAHHQDDAPPRVLKALEGQLYTQSVESMVLFLYENGLASFHESA